MIGLGHSSVGAGVAVLVYETIPTAPLWLQIVIVVSVAFVSHYLTDLLPHGHYKVDYKNPTFVQKIMLLIDLPGWAIFLLYLCLLNNSFGIELILVACGIAAAQLTDVWDWVIVARGWVKLEGAALKHRRFHQLIHWHDVRDEHGKRSGLPVGWWDVWQVAVALGAVWLLTT